MTEVLEAPAVAAVSPELECFAPVYPLPRLELVSGHGAWVKDSQGKTYLDFVSGIAVNALGHTPASFAPAIARQMKQLGQVSNLFGHAPGLELARELCAATGYDRVFFCNSGTEGVEAALKFARARAGARGLKGRDIVAFTGGFHGRTGFALSATHHPPYREPFEPLIPGVRFAPFNDSAALAQVLDENVCAVIVEPVQGEGGAVPAERGFLEAIARRCRELDAALVLDEVQSGMGRCGYLLAAEHYGVRADYTVLSKALGGGLPLAAVLMTAEAAQSLAPGMHGCTFGGGPVATTAGLFILKRVREPALLERVRARGLALGKALDQLVKRHASLTTARGLGLLRAIELAATAAYDPPALVRAAREHGLLLVRGGERAVRLLPPLTVTTSEIKQAIARLDRALDGLESAAAETA